ncbi:NgoFVII restriction endonuclease [Sulfobacillus acidophilus TPY]|uniref:Uncharacterized protein n=1 Tax=Sulfobacillus acidophilus (strain ATCC 700253 / DSM 10332 / NAL) TaxID=679936 RepID=G8U0Y8_SULAD|nr:NgoFVII restriction endonuclease [Sulfobacillus acidophilus TPY]AEW06533.1 hypothetical protein Sulac_3078 [Sulfobacillus acidophilus DSM 10332]
MGSAPGELQRQYYALLNWLFLAPALPLLRIQAIGHGHHGYLYPMTAIVYGKSNAGKTDFLKTVLRLMTGLDVLVPGGDFTKTAYAAWAKRAQALPMVVDDIQRDRFQRHAVELIKSTDYFDTLPAPCLVFSANADIDGLATEVTKRAYVVPIAASIPVSAAAKDRYTRQIQQQVGTALYRAYLGRVLPDLADLAPQWDNPEPPDPYQTASSVLLEVLSEALGTTPPWARVLRLDDYLAAPDGHIRETLINLWQTRPQMFRIDRAAHQLVLEASSQTELGRWRKTLPSYLVIQQAQLSLILHLEETERFLGMRLNPRRWWQRR